MFEAYFTGFLGSLFTQAPVCIVWIIGIGLAINFRQRYPRASMLAIAAFLVGMLALILNSLIGVWLFPTLVRNGMLRTIDYGVLSMSLACLTALIVALSWGLAIAAIFIGRDIPGQ